VWDRAAEQLSRPGYSDKQVQVVFLHTTIHAARNVSGNPPRFPERFKEMQALMAKVLAHCVTIYPNLRIAYLTSDGFRHFSRLEPHVWQEAFAVKWLIASQIQGADGTVFEGPQRRLPWMQWGPYIWDNSWDRSYFWKDGVHPQDKAKEIVVAKYWDLLKADPVTKGWLSAKRP